MKKISVLVVVFLTVLLCGCSAQNPEEIGITTIYIENDGNVIATFVEDFSQSYYDVTDLQTATEEEIAAYNEACGEELIEMTFCEVEGNIAKMQLNFESADVYTDYIGEVLFNGTIGEALEAGYDLKYSLVNPLDAEDIIGEYELLTMQDSNIIIVENAIRVRTESKILYMSSDAKYIDEYEIDGYDNADATVILY